jgi:hypothetical protein
VAVSIVLPTCIAVSQGGRPYWITRVTVPSGATQSNPYVVNSHGARFTMWWPELVPGLPYSGLVGVFINITEPNGHTDQTWTGCAECGFGIQSWYSNDRAVGITFYDNSLGTVNLLVLV